MSTTEAETVGNARQDPEAVAREVVGSLAPYLQSDGVACRVDRLEAGILYIEISTQGPPDASLIMLIRLGIERKITDRLPEIDRVELL